MQIFSDYLEKHCSHKPFIVEDSIPGVQNIIVIPSLGEPDLLKTLQSLKNCKRPVYPVEVIVVLNSSEISPAQILTQNEVSKKELDAWAKINNHSHLSVFSISQYNIPRKIAGAGYARKIGMDEAIFRFHKSANPNGIITSLDADATVDVNYLIEIENLFIKDKKANACSIYFEHQITGGLFSDNVFRTIVDYELHLRYYKQALVYIGFPYYHHTVGSGFAVRATAYCKQGGMNRKQAGEDFYFLHKIMPLGHYHELNSTSVYPSSRPSDRVPFGTGATVRQFAIEEKKEFLTYNFKSFEPLKKLFAIKERLFKIKHEDIQLFRHELDEILVNFLDLNNFTLAIQEMNNNSVKIETFVQRFFVWFDAFRLIKYLNHAHSGTFTKQKVSEAAVDLLNTLKIKHLYEYDAKSLLLFFRNLEQNK